MIAVMQRLQSVGLNPPLINEESPRWVFNAAEVSKDRIESLVSKHAELSFEYTVLCTHLAHNFRRPGCTPEEITEQLVTALMMAELLIYIYMYYLAVPREVLRLQNEQIAFRMRLYKRGFLFDSLNDYGKKADKLTQFVRSSTAQSNWCRLFLVRGKRLLNSITPLVKNLESFGRFVAFVDKYGNPFLAYLSWAFYIPRLFTNLFLLFKHLIPGSWMGEKEKELGFLRRLQVQLQRRWFELANDSVWLIAGVLGCFVWLGPLAPIGTYINVVLYGYDVLLAGLRAGIELYRLEKLASEYEVIASTALSTQIDEIGLFQKHLHERIVFERKRLLLSTATASVLTIAIIICAPVLAFNPWVPFVGAFLLLAITIISFCLTQLLEKQRPSSEINELPELDKENTTNVLSPEVDPSGEGANLFTPCSRLPEVSGSPIDSAPVLPESKNSSSKNPPGGGTKSIFESLHTLFSPHRIGERSISSSERALPMSKTGAAN
jgi:hypothetical protein